MKKNDCIRKVNSSKAVIFVNKLLKVGGDFYENMFRRGKFRYNVDGYKADIVKKYFDLLMRKIK